jgi:ComF family protein
LTCFIQTLALLAVWFCRSKEHFICLHCYANLPRTNFHKIKENPVEKIFWGRAPLEKATSFLYFTKRAKVQNLMHNFKYRGFQEIGNKLGRIFGAEIYKDKFLDDVDLIIPVPLHKRKLKKRGFNQSEIIAKGISEESGKKLETDILIRGVFSETQTRKNRFDRWMNVSKIFQVNKPKELDNKHILLVDDVVTTGATIEACYQAMKEAADIKMSLATLAFSSK